MSYRAVLAACALMATGCAGNASNMKHSSFAAPNAGRVISVTPDQISQMNARDAWEIVQRSAPRLQLNQYAVRHINNQGNPRPLLVVDGMPVDDIRALRDIDANFVKSVRILGDIDGSVQYGSLGSGGVIEVVTRR